jgi:Mn-dependent DtxR family transcriptional regulator
MLYAYLLEKYGPRLNVKELAEVLDAGEQSLSNRLKDSEIATYLDGGKRFADARDVAEYLDRKRQEAREAIRA